MKDLKPEGPADGRVDTSQRLASLVSLESQSERDKTKFSSTVYHREAVIHYLARLWQAAVARWPFREWCVPLSSPDIHADPGPAQRTYLPAPSQLLVRLCRWKHQAGAGREGAECDEVPPSMVTAGWPCPLDKGDESCLVARLVLVPGTIPAPPRSGMGTLHSAALVTTPL